MYKFLFQFLWLGFVFLLMSNVFAENITDKSGFNIKLSTVTQESATIKNAVGLYNTRMYNNFLGGSTNYNHLLNSGSMKGHSLELNILSYFKGWTGDFFLRYGELKSDDGKLLNLYSYEKAYISNTAGSASIFALINRSTMYMPIEDNSLKTLNLGYIANFFLFKGRGNEFIEHFALRLGGQLKGDSARMQTNYGMGSSYFLSGIASTTNTTLKEVNTPFGIDPFNKNQIRYNEGGFLFLAGFSYSIPFKERHTINIKADYLYGHGQGSFNHKNSYLGYNPFLNTLLPGTTKYKSGTDVFFSGNKYYVSYSYNTNDSFGFIVSYSQSNITHTVKSSKVTTSEKDILGLLYGDVRPLAANSFPGMGPKPSSLDIQRTISIEFQISY